MYSIGVDLGTVYTAAATLRNGHAEIVSLGGRAAAIPSVVLVREDASVLIGEPANRRALLEPSRVAREFKRRFGDSTPIMLGGAPHSPEALMARLLRSVVSDVTEQLGGKPDTICLCHPANWGPYKTDLLRQAVDMADLGAPVIFAVEPVAAAAYYSQQERVAAGSLVAVYDLGGGTFDAAVVRVGGDGSFEIVGRPEGIEHLGGADFDAAVFEHVRSVVGDSLEALDDTSPAAIAAVAHLREECTSAKETLSADTDTSIPVLLPNKITDVRLTRAELERMIRPPLYDTISALQRAIRSAGVSAADLHSVLLIGGSSRIPLVSQLVGAELDRPVAVDAHPKHAVALGAALIAGAQQRSAADAEAARAADADVAFAAPPTAAILPPEVLPTAAVLPPAVLPTAAVRTSAPIEPSAATPPGAGAGAVGGQPTEPNLASSSTGQRRSSPAGPVWRRPWFLAAAAVVLVVVVLGAVKSFVSPSSPTAGVNSATHTPKATTASGASASAASDPLFICPTDATAERWGCLTSAKLLNGQVTFAVTSNFAPSDLEDAAHYHLHLFLTNPAGTGTTDPPDSIMQVGANEGTWYNVYSDSVTVLEQAQLGGRLTPPDPKMFSLLCVRTANGLHGLALDKSGGHRTGNCIKLS